MSTHGHLLSITCRDWLVIGRLNHYILCLDLSKFVLALDRFSWGCNVAGVTDDQVCRVRASFRRFRAFPDSKPSCR